MTQLFHAQSILAQVVWENRISRFARSRESIPLSLAIEETDLNGFYHQAPTLAACTVPRLLESLDIFKKHEDCDLIIMRLDGFCN